LSDEAGSDAPRRPLATGSRVALAALALAAFGLLVALGTWQLQRLAWKLDLIERVEARVHASPVAAPGVPDWPHVSAARDEYRAVQLEGRFDHDRETLVQASTTLGAGFWVLTPLLRDDGTTVLVNRGFVPPASRERAARRGTEPAGEVRVTGLLRVTEPGGGFLRSNDPAGDRWYSRDVAAIGSARGLQQLAPYFVDQAAASGASAGGAPAGPVGGLTVIRFHNNHLVYALTWYGLALGLVVIAVVVRRTLRKPTR